MKRLSFVKRGIAPGHKNFGLSKEEFDRMLSDLKSGSDELYQRVFLAHFKDCVTYLKQNCGAGHEDAYDASMDSLLLFCERLKKGQIKYGNLRFLFTQMARQEYLRGRKKQNQTASLPEEIIPEMRADNQIPKEAQQAFDQAWQKLGQECKKLLQAFYYNSVKLKELAFESSISESAMRKQKQRCIIKLQSVFHRYYRA